MDGRAVEREQLPDDRQAQPGPAEAEGRVVARLRELVENPADHFRRDADPCVRDGDGEGHRVGAQLARFGADLHGSRAR